jgi:apolipoprotein N-acyltransferase
MPRQKIIQSIRDFRLPILSGILIGTSYIPFPPWALGFALVPLWIYWGQEQSWRRIWWGGWLTQYLLTLIGFNWVAHTVHEFGQMPWPLAIMTLLLFCAFANLHVPLAGLLWFFAKRKLRLSPGAAFWLLPATFIIAEMSYPMIFDWHFGYPLLPAGLPMAQLGEWFGFRGLSAMVILINAAVLWLFQRRRSTRALVIGSGVLALGLLCLNLTGIWLKARLPAPDAQAGVLVVQANIGNLDKIEAERGDDDVKDSVISRYLDLTRQGKLLGHVDYVVWPETAFPHLLNEPFLFAESYARRLREFLQEENIRLMTGAYGYRPDTREPLNSFYLLNSDGTLADRPYSKTRLLAFGEYIPGGDWFPIIYRWLPQVGHFGRGGGPQVGTINNLRVGSLICYEGLFADFARALALKNAQVMVNVTNDSWYGTWEQPYQHLYMTLARAIELRRPIIRATNTGISTIALASGEILDLSPLHDEWVHLYDLRYLREPQATGFMGWGYYSSWILVGLLFCLSLWRRRFERTAQS